MSHKIRKGVFSALLLACLTTFNASAEVESKDPIIMTLHDWTGQLITTNLMGRVLQDMGYNIKYQQADYLAQFAGLESGDLHIAMEMWQTTGKEAMEKSLATGNTVDLGETGMQAIEEWWYPIYMKEKCPGLPDWQALNDCAELFSTAETAPSGRYLGAPVTWGGFDDERVEALELDFEVVHAGTDAALFAELESAYQRKAPWIGWVYTPHWAPIKFEGEFIQFPEYSDECYNDPSVGVNPNMAYDCAKPSGWIKKVGWKAGEEKWPCAYQAIKKFTVDNQTVGTMVGEVDLDGKSVEEVVDNWIKTNEDTWKGWTECN
ncbi:MAG: ABC transporter substrate-binding protein [Gammaproteobacteria bacterium]|nr:ABC transporter substrate-binding protein [Gammaproteobacteria bacterium]